MLHEKHSSGRVGSNRYSLPIDFVSSPLLAAREPRSKEEASLNVRNVWALHYTMKSDFFLSTVNLLTAILHQYRFDQYLPPWTLHWAR